MSYTYDIICLTKNAKVYTEGTISSKDFISALYNFIVKNEIINNVFLIYCRRPISGDLKLMGKYDGKCTIMKDGIRFSHILKTTENKDYTFLPDGFRRVYY